MSQRKVNKSTCENSCPADLVNECVKFIFCREGSKKPIRQADIENHLNTTNPTPHDKKIVIEKAEKVLKQIYGYKLVKLKGKGVNYIVVLNKPCESSLQSSYTNTYHRKLLIAALTHIYMAGGSVKENEMWKFLSKTKLLDENDQAGRKNFINTFTKQLYLEYNKVGPNEQNKHEFRWGQRADEEIPKEFILKKMAEAFNKEPNYWREQYNTSQESDNRQQ